MRFVFRAVLAVLALAIVAAGVGYLVLRRGDIDTATLRDKYGNARSEYVALANGVEMHFRDQGKADGPVLLMIHGFSASLATWEPMLVRLGQTYRVVTIDLPGHGLTQAPADYRPSMARYVEDVEAFAAARGLSTFAIAGNSMGGGLSWEYALAHPERVEALILVDAAGWAPETREDPPLVLQLMRNPIARTILKDLDNSALIRGGLQRSFADPSLVDDAMVMRYSEMSRAPGHRDILLGLQTDGRRAASHAVLNAIRAPTLILWGDQDHLIPVADARRFAAAIPGSELVTWADDGHLPQEEHPDRTADAIAAFLGRVHGARAAEAVTTP